MSEISKYEAYKKKLEGVCEENELTFRFSNNTYPITLTVRPIADMYTQMSMLEQAEEKDYRSQDSYLKFVYKDGVITYQTSETFAIGDALFSKLKNLFKNMHYCWLQYFFRAVVENKLLSPKQMPVIDEDEADDDLPEGAEPLEEFAAAEDLDVPDVESDITDEEIAEATSIVRMENKVSTALLERRMGIGVNRAESIIDSLEEIGVISEADEQGQREVLPCDEPDDTEKEDVENG